MHVTNKVLKFSIDLCGRIHQSIHTLTPMSVCVCVWGGGTNHKSSNRIESSRLGQDLSH